MALSKLRETLTHGPPDTRYDTAVRLSEAVAWRWRWWLEDERIGKSVDWRDQLKIRRGNQDKRFFDRWEFMLLHGCREFLFRLGTLASGNRLAKAARMLAIECLLHRLR